MVTRWTIGCVLVCTACAAAPALETVRARAVEVDGFQAGEVVVGDQPVLRILADDGELTALDRATIIAGRVQGYLNGDGIVPEQITFRMHDGEMALMYGDDVLATVDRLTAAREELSLERLAEKWRTSLVEALLAQETTLPGTVVPDDTPPSPSPPLPSVQEYGADNGVVFLVCPLPDATQVAVRVTILSGSLDDGRWLGYGLATAVSRTVPLGTRQRTQAQLEEQLTALGASLTTEVTPECVSYGLVVTPGKLNDALELLADLVQQATFPAEAVEAALQQQRQVTHSPEGALALAEERLRGLLFRTHPLRYPAAGKPATVALLTRLALLDYYNRHYVPDNAVVTVTGAVDQSAAGKLQRAFGSWVYRPAPPTATVAEPIPQTARQQTVALPVTFESGGVAWRLVPPWHPDAPALSVCTALLEDRLAELSTPDLPQIQLRAGVPTRSTGQVSLLWVAPAEQHAQLREQCLHAVASLSAEPPEPAALVAGVERVRAAVREAFATPAQAAKRLSEDHAVTGSANHFQALLTALDRLQPNNIQGAFQYYFAPERTASVSIRRGGGTVG